jgi:hypothetical protein
VRVLIFGTSYVEGQHSRYLFGLWRDLTEKLNPAIDMLVVDTASPDLPSLGRANLIRFEDNIGHLSRTGRDGWGRAFCAGLQHGVDNRYTHIVHIETDLLFARPVAEVLEKMRGAEVSMAASVASPYAFIDTGLMFMTFSAAKAFLRKYRWEDRVQSDLPEVVIGQMFEDRLFTLPLWGMRNDLNVLTPRNMTQLFPGGIDWLTHCKDPAVYREFLRVNGHG